MLLRAATCSSRTAALCSSRSSSSSERALVQGGCLSRLCAPQPRVWGAGGCGGRVGVAVEGWQAGRPAGMWPAESACKA